VIPRAPLKGGGEGGRGRKGREEGREKMEGNCAVVNFP